MRKMRNMRAQRFRESWRASLGKDKFKQAGLTYLFTGLLVILFTFWAQLVPQNRAADGFLLLPGVFFVLIFAIVVYRGSESQPLFLPERLPIRRALSRVLFHAGWWVTRILALTNAVRALLFFSNAVGQNLHLTLSPTRLFVVSSTPEPLFLVNAVLMAFIAFMLARAGWNLPPGKTRRIAMSS